MRFPGNLPHFVEVVKRLPARKAVGGIRHAEGFSCFV